jgi:hypothetical protein
MHPGNPKEWIGTAWIDQAFGVCRILSQYIDSTAMLPQIDRDLVPKKRFREKMIRNE